MHVVLQHHRPITLNLRSGNTLRMSVMGETAEVSTADASSPELVRAMRKNLVRELTSPDKAPPAEAPSSKEDTTTASSSAKRK